MRGKSRRAWKHFFYSNIFLGLVVGALIFIIINLVRVHFQNQQVEVEIGRLQSETKRLEARRLETLDALKFTDSPSFVEEKARTQFNLVKPGESVAILPASESDVPASGTDELSAQGSLSNLSRWRKIFFKK